MYALPAVAKDINIGDKMLMLAQKCAREECNNLAYHNRKYCSRACLSKVITKTQWANPEHRKNVSQKNRISMNMQYREGLLYEFGKNMVTAKRLMKLAYDNSCNKEEREFLKNELERVKLKLKVSKKKKSKKKSSRK